MTTLPEKFELADHPLIGRLFRHTAEEEQAVLNGILLAGLNQGWLLWPQRDQIITDCASVDRVIAEINERPQVWPNQPDPWRDCMPSPPSDLGSGPAWVVLSQRCDLIRGYSLEPFIELAPAYRINDPGEARQARVNSTRSIAIASDNEGLFAAELRSRAWLPKSSLVEVPACHASIGNSVEHKRFRHRLGGRYWRDAVPDDLRDSFAKPVSKAFSKGSRNRLLRHFSMVLGRRVGEKVLVLAIIGPNSTEEAARTDWDQVLDELAKIAQSACAILHEDSQPVSEYDLSVIDWLDSFKFEFDDLSYGSTSTKDHEAAAM